MHLSTAVASTASLCQIVLVVFVCVVHPRRFFYLNNRGLFTFSPLILMEFREPRMKFYRRRRWETGIAGFPAVLSYGVEAPYSYYQSGPDVSRNFKR